MKIKLKPRSRNPKIVHILPRRNGWAIKRETTKKAWLVTPTRDPAVSKASKIKGIEKIVVHKKDGTLWRVFLPEPDDNLENGYILVKQHNAKK
jgi:hypothetical protein